MNTYLYRVPEHCEESIYQVQSVHGTQDQLGCKWIVEQAAENYFSDHDGWDCHWPLTFELLDDDQHVIYRAEVQLESQPLFIVSSLDTQD